MSKQIISAIAIASTIGLTAACGNKAEEAAPADPAVEVHSEEIKTIETPDEEPIDEEALPVPADFEDEMSNVVTEENFEDELGTLEKELESET